MGFNNDKLGFKPKLYWDDLPPREVIFNPSGAAVAPVIDTTTGFQLWRDTFDNIVAYRFQMPHNWYKTTFNFHVHFAKTTAAAGTVEFKVKYAECPIGQPIGAFSTNTAMTEVMTVGSTVNQGIASINITPGSNASISTTYLIWLERDATVGNANDTYGADVMVIDVDLHIQKYADLGSVNEYSR